MKTAAATASTTGFWSESSNYSLKEVLTTNFQVENHLVQTYATDDIIAGKYIEVAPYVKPLTISLKEFGNKIWL